VTLTGSTPGTTANDGGFVCISHNCRMDFAEIDTDGSPFAIANFPKLNFQEIG